MRVFVCVRRDVCIFWRVDSLGNVCLTCYDDLSLAFIITKVYTELDVDSSSSNSTM